MSTAVLVVVSVIVLMAPGLAVGWCLRLRGLLLAAAAPLLTFVIGGVAGMWTRIVGIPWTPVTALLVYALVAGASLLLTRRLRTPDDRVIRLPDGPRWTLAGPLAGSLLALFIAGQGIGWDVGAVNQSWDPPWHANLIRYMSATDIGDWTASSNNQLAWGGQFYPTGAHAVEALVVDLVAQDTARVFNVFMVLSVVLLPAAVFVLARVVAPAWPLAAAASGLVAVIPPDHPWETLGTHAWAWSMTAMPVAVALAVLAAGRRSLLALPAAALGVAATLALQPAGLASTLVLLGCWLLLGLSGLRARAVAFGRLAVVGVTSLLLLAPLVASGRSSVESVATFFATEPEPLSSSVPRTVFLRTEALNDEPMIVLAVFTALGLGFAATRRPLRWVAFTYLVTVALHIASRSAPVDVRPYLTGLWYSDVARLARLQGAMTVVLVGLGVAAVAVVLLRLPRPSLARAAYVAAPLALVLGLVVEHRTVGADIDVVQLAYDEHPGGPSISDQQVSVLKTVAPLFGPDEHVVVDSWQGGIWLYALTGVRAIEGRYGDPDAYAPDLLLRRLNEVDTNRVVQDVVVRHKVCGVYVGTGSVVPKDWTWSGFAGLAEGEVDAYEQAYGDADSQVYLLTGPLAERAGCRSADGPSVDVPEVIRASG